MANYIAHQTLQANCETNGKKKRNCLSRLCQVFTGLSGVEVADIPREQLYILPVDLRKYYIASEAQAARSVTRSSVSVIPIGSQVENEVSSEGDSTRVNMIV